MNRKIVLLNVALLAALAILGWVLRSHWMEARAREQAVLSKPPRVQAVVPPPAAVAPGPANPADYSDVVAKTLFSKDRDPNVAIVLPPPPPPKPEEPVPPRPSYHGQMGIGKDPVAFLSLAGKNNQKGYHAGDEVGPFKLVAFDREQIKFEWQGKTLEYKLSELKPVDAAPSTPAPAAETAPPPPPAKPASQEGILGAQDGERRSCVVSDRSPNGTVKDGYRKVLGNGMIGEICYWEPVK